MANIRVDVNYTIKDGSKIAFRSPVDCSAITGLVVYYPAEDGTATSREFVLSDAHGHDVGNIDHLFAENVIVKVILDVTAGMAYVQNADTNAYIEQTFIKTVNGVTPDKNGNVDLDTTDGKPGADGTSIYYTNSDLSYNPNSLLNIATISMADIVTNGRTIHVGDLVLASNGVLATVTNVDTAISKVSVKSIASFGGGGSSGSVASVQSDLAQNDSTAADYVKGRTHYAYQEILLPETKVTMTQGVGQRKLEGSPEFYVGDLYIVTIDGVEYLCSFGTLENGTFYYWDFIGENMPLHISSYAADIDYGMGVFIDFDGIENPVYGTYTVSIKSATETVKQLDEKYIPDSIARVRDLPQVPQVQQVQPDMSQNDENAVDYVKNRTHWAEENDGTAINGTFQFTKGNEYFGTEIISEYSEFVVGNSYTVVWDGVEYPDLICWDDDGYNTVGAPYGDFTGELPFCLWTEIFGRSVVFYAIANNDSETHDISVTGTFETYHPLDDRFIPDTVMRFEDFPFIPEYPEDIGAIPVPETAAVGQTIVVTAVDETGKPTEWECVDFSVAGGNVGLVTNSPDGTKWRIIVGNDGIVAAEKLGGTDPEEPDEPIVPDEPDVPDVPEIPDGETYSITRNLTNVMHFDDSSTIEEGAELLECFVSNDECTMDGATATVTMGGEDITATAWDNGVVNIAEVTGDVVINIDAVKIHYVTPSAADFTNQINGSNILLAGYTGTETALEIPDTMELDGKTYGTQLRWDFGVNDGVKHLKISSGVTKWGSFSGFSSQNLKTLVDLTNFTVTSTKNCPALEKPIQYFGTETTARSCEGNTSIKTLRSIEYPETVTALSDNNGGTYMNCKGLIDGGIIPPHITNMRRSFYGCSNLRRIRVETIAPGCATDGEPYYQTFNGVNALDIELYLDSGLWSVLRKSPNLKWDYKFIGGEPYNRIIIIGDSLTGGTYGSYLHNLIPNNATVNESAQGGYKSDQIYNEKMMVEPVKSRLPESIVVIWHGTNGYGSEGHDVITAKMVAALNGNQRYLLIPPTSQGAGDDVYENWVSTYGAEHVMSMGDWFTNNGYTVSDYLTDGTHFDADGYALVAQAVYEKIQHWL